MAALMTYSEQLKHPNWQRKRLEMLEMAGWECQECGAKETTLHVHHKQYFKGRKVWEYDAAELAVLCEVCHKDQHQDLDVIKQIVANTYPAWTAGLLAGFNCNDINFDPATIYAGRDSDALAYAAGFVAYLVFNLGDIGRMLEVARYAASLHSEYAEARMVFDNRGNTFGEEA